MLCLKLVCHKVKDHLAMRVMSLAPVVIHDGKGNVLGKVHVRRMKNRSGEKPEVYLGFEGFSKDIIIDRECTFQSKERDRLGGTNDPA